MYVGRVYTFINYFKVKKSSVSDPLFFLTDPDPNQKPKTDTDPGG